MEQRIVDYLAGHYPNYLTMILSGSLIDGTADSKSDLDVIVIVSDRNRLYNETLQLNKLKLQTFIIPVQHLYERLYADYIGARGHFIGLLAKGLHFYGNRQLTKEISDHCVELKQLGPKPMSNDEHLRVRIRITELVNKLNNSNEKWENLILEAGELIDELIGFKLHSEGTWKGDGKHRMKFIEAHAPSFKKQLVSALEFAYHNKNYERLTELAKVEIENKGGAIEFYAKESIQLTPNEDFVSVQIRFSGNYEQRKNSVLTLNHHLLKLKGESNSRFTHYFYSTDVSGSGFPSMDIFCIVHADNQWLNNFFMDWLYHLKEGQHLIDISFPSFMDPKYKFAKEQLYKEALPIFAKLNDYNLEEPEKAFDASFQIASALGVLKELNAAYFTKSHTRFEDFLHFLFKSCFVFSYDSNESVTSKELLRRRENAILQFEGTYQSQKEGIEGLWNAKNHTTVRDGLDDLVKNLSGLASELDSFPAYALHLFDNGRPVSKEIVFLKEMAIRCMEILFIESSYIPYIIYAALQVENKSFRFTGSP